MSTVPEAARYKTPINLKATAGLRLLRPEQSDALLLAVENMLRSYPFLYDPEDAVEIMGGLDEGKFAWVTVNYLLNVMGGDATQTCVVLDLGGGSTQVGLARTCGRASARGWLVIYARGAVFPPCPHFPLRSCLLRLQWPPPLRVPACSRR